MDSLLKRSEVMQSCPTLCDPMDGSLPGSSVHGIFQDSLLEMPISVCRLEVQIPMHMGKEGREGERKRIILGDYGLYIQVSMSMFRSPNSFSGPSHSFLFSFFSISWNPLYLRSQSFFELINKILCMSIDNLPSRYIIHYCLPMLTDFS